MSTEETLKEALAGHRRGWSVFDSPYGSKATYEKGWQNLRLTEGDLEARFNGQRKNLKAHTGEASGNLADVDLDAREAVSLASQFLPPTDAIFGRKSVGQTHRLYMAAVASGEFLDIDGKPLVELRTSGRATLIPPSQHPAGEKVVWFQRGDPAVVDGDVLLAAVARLATAALLVRHWPDGSRQDAALALAGALLRHWDVPDVEIFIDAVTEAAGDEEAHTKRIQVVKSTAKKLEAGEAVTGWPTLAQLVGEDVAKRARQWLGMETRKAIVAEGRELRDISDDALKALVGANEPPTVFWRGGRLVRVSQDERGVSYLEILNSDALRGELARASDWIRLLKEGQTHIPPPPAVVNDLLALGAWPGIQALEGLVTGPVLVRGGDILAEPGYHAESGYLYVGDKLDMPSMTVPQAVALLSDELLADFPFNDAASRANALALMVTMCVRPAVNGPTPLFVVDGPTPGTGKGLMAGVCVIPSDPHGGAVMAPGRDEEEWRKRLTTILLASRRAVLLDNVTEKLDAAPLAAVITAWPDWEDRLLGTNTMVRVPNLTIFVATGNNLTFSQELVRRTVWIRLVPREEQPWTRTGFRHPDLRAWAVEHRAELAGAVVTLVRAWLEKKPSWKGAPPGSFEKWARVVGGILDTAGVEGFLGNAVELWDKLDPERQAWGALIQAWADGFGDERVTAAQLYEKARAEDLLLDLLPNAKRGDDHGLRIALGKALQSRVDRVVGDWQIKRVGTAHKVAEFRLSKVAPR